MDERSDRIARRFEVPMLVAAALVIPAIVLGESDLGKPWEQVGEGLNWAIWIAFLTEVVVMLAVVSNRWGWARRHPLELAVVVLTPPLLGGLFQSIRALRLLRLVRLLRLAPLVRRLFTVEGVRYVALIAVLVLVGAAQGYSQVEHHHRTVADGLYWAVGMMTTVGFGHRAETGIGQALSVVLVVLGVGFVSILTGAIAQRFLAPAVEELEETEERVARGEVDLAGDVREVIARLERLEAALGGASRAAGSPGG